MAEVAVLALNLLQIITPQLIERLNLQLEVKGEIKTMESWLTFMQAFMEDNYGHRDSKTLLDLLRKVGETIFAIEDIVDEFNHDSLLYSFPDNIVELGHRINLPEKVARVKNALETIKEQKAFASNSINPPSSPTSTSISISPLPHLKDEMVGYENLKEEFMTRLVRGDKRLVALAVDGPPGSGKSLFVKNIFSQPRIKKVFKFRGFVSGVGKAPTNVILQKLCESMNVPGEGSTDPQSRLRRFLDGKRYLIVVDDVWRVDDWKNLKDYLPNSCKRSRIIMTTRSSNASAICDHVTSLQGLEQHDALKLFVRRAFPNRECPSELSDISMDFVSRCGGLPLAIVAVAGALAQRQQNLHEWKRFHGKLGCEMWTNANLGAINDSLLRSYMELSSTLRCCLLYMSIFPEDLPVGRGRLVRLWVAERFAMATDCRTAEEVAEDYLNQLVQSNLILVSNSDFHNNFRLSYPIRNFVLRKSKEENIATVFSESQAMNREQTRRLSFHDRCRLIPPEDVDFRSVRSMFLLRSQRETDPSDSDFKKNLRQLLLIKVLDVQGANISNFTKKITTRLALVRYLSFRDTNIKSIPTSIRNLSHLETLDLRRTHLTKLPSEISDLHNLRHLLASKHDEAFGSVQGVELAEGTIISKLTKLQSLSLVKVDPSGRILKDLKALTQLRKLGLTDVRGEHGKDLCSALESIKSLETLDITASEGERIELEEALKSPPKSLRRLYLKGRLEKIPAWISGLDCAVRIDLKQSGLKDSPLEDLKGLDNLKELRLIDCFAGEELRFEGGGFEKLEIIVMEDLANLRRLKVESGAAPKLKKILVRRCPLLIKPFRVGRLVEVDKEEDIDGRDYVINKWIDRVCSSVPDRINDKIDSKLRRISGRR